MENLLKQYNMPDGKVLELNAKVVDILLSYSQGKNSNEVGGILIGSVSIQGDILVKDITMPYPEDSSSTVSFIRKSIKHVLKVKKQYMESKGYMNYLGNWHTHPHYYPNPSNRDIKSWIESIMYEKTEAEFIIFIIVVNNAIKVWAGNRSNREITELVER